MEHDLGERLSHPRGRRDGAAGAGVHAPRRHRVRAVGRRRRAGRRRVRAADVVLLQRPQRLLRGDRQVPGGAPDLGRGDARSLRRQERSVVEAPLPLADRRRLADRAAAVQQRRPHRDPGARRRARRHQLAAHELARRSAGAADRGRDDHRSPDAADPRSRERCRQPRRPARRVVLRRSAHARPRRRELRLLRHHRSDGRHGGGRRGRLSAAGDRRELLPVPAGGGAPREDHRRRQRLRARGRTGPPDSVHRRVCRREAAGPAGRDADHSRQGGVSAARSIGCAPRRADTTTRCRRCSTAFGPTPRSERCATCSATCGASDEEVPIIYRQ